MTDERKEHANAVEISVFSMLCDNALQPGLHYQDCIPAITTITPTISDHVVIPSRYLSRLIAETILTECVLKTFISSLTCMVAFRQSVY